MRLSDPRFSHDHADFEVWRAASLDHEIAFEREAAAWDRLDRAGALRPAQMAIDPDLLARGHAPAPVRVARNWIALAASLVLLLGGGGGSALLWLSASPAYATAVGERRVVRLADGTSVELNTDSKIVIRYARGRRTVRLVRGEAMFHVAKDPRPFLVQTPNARLNAPAGDFSVRLAGDDAEVTVEQGMVKAETALGQPTVAGVPPLGPDSEALVGRGGALIHQVSADEVDRVLAWRQGAIALSGQTLGEAVTEFNRYNTRKIVIGDQTTGAIRVGGYFRTSDVDGFVTAVAKTFPVRVSQDPQGEIVLSGRS